MESILERRVVRALIRELKKQRTKKPPRTGVIGRAALEPFEWDLVQTVKDAFKL